MLHSLTANLRFTLDQAAARQVQSQATSMFSSIKGRVDLQIDPKAQSTLQRLSASTAELQANLRALNAAAGPAAASVARMTSSLNAAAAAGTGATSGLRAAAATTRDVGRAAASSSYDMQEFGRQVALAGRRFVAFSAAAGTMFAVTRAIREGIAEAVQFDLQLNKLRQVSGDTAGEVKKVGDEVMRLSTNLGASSTELLEAAVTLKQAGLATKDVKTALEGIAQASLAPNFSSMKQITEGAIAGFQQFGKSVSNIREQLGAMNAVAGDFAVEASDLVTAVQKAGGTASQTGAQFNELLAIFTSVRSTTRESADSIATGMRTIFTRLQRNDTVDALAQLGVQLRYTKQEAEQLGQVDMEGQFVGAYEAVRRLSEGLSKIRTTDPRFSSAIEELGGYRQVSRVIPMIQKFGEAQKALNVARLGSASLEAAAATRQDAIATKMAKTREEFQKFTNELVQSRGFKAMVDNVLTLATALAKVLDVAKPLLPVLMAMGAIKLVSGAAQFGTGLWQGYWGQLGGSKPMPRRFATGGVVPGVGDGDTVPAQLEPGEFVIRKASAQKIGYDTLYAMNAQRYATGGPVAGKALGKEAYNRIIREYQAKTGIDFRKGLGIQFMVGMPPGVGAAKDTGYGAFNYKTRQLYINPKTVTTEAQLRATLAHELGHALDAHFGGGKKATQGSGLLGQVAKDYGDQSRSLQALGGLRMSAKFAQYRLARHETFADAFRDHLTGDGRDARIDTITKQVAQETGTSRLGRAMAWVRRRFMRFAQGGTPGTKVDALLTPGEFVIDKKTAARLGPDALNRMNQYGDVPRFANGGPVLRYATGGGAFDLNALMMKVLQQVSGGGRGADERMSEAGERIAKAVKSGKLPADPAQAEAYLLRAAGLGAKAADERERRLRKRMVVGAVNETGASIVDSTPAATQSIPLSYKVHTGKQSAVEQTQRFREMEALKAIEAQGLSGSAAEREYTRLMAAAKPALSGGATASTPVNSGAVPVLPAAQTLAPKAVPTGGAGRPPGGPPPVATGPAPDDGRQGNWKSVYGAAYRDARRGGMDPYQARATAIMALDANGYGAQAVGAVGKLDGSLTADRRRQRASAQAGPEQWRNPNDFEPNRTAAAAFRQPAHPSAATQSNAWFNRNINAGEAYSSGFQRKNFVSEVPPETIDKGRNGIPVAKPGPSTYGLAPVGPTSAVAFGPNAPIPLAGTPGATFGFAPGGPTGNASNGRQVQMEQEAAKAARASAKAASQAAFTNATTFGALDVAEMRTNTAVDAKGGKALLSTTTQLATSQAEHARVEKELTKGIDRQLRSLYPTITSTESYRKAQEMAADAMRKNALVLRNGAGTVVGTAALGEQLAAAGRSPTGAGWFSGSGFRQRAGSFFGNLGRTFTPQGGMMGAYGLMMGAPMLGEAIGPSESTIKNAAAGGGVGAQLQGAAASGLTMAAMGAGVGMMFGPWGAAIGAAAGGLYGLAKGFIDTGKEIREAKLGASLQHLGDMLTAAANNVRGGGVNNLDPLAVRAELTAAQGIASEKANEAVNRGRFNPMRLFGRTSLTPAEEAAARTRETRAALGGQAGAMVALLSRQAEDIGKNNLNGNPNDLVKQMVDGAASGPLLQAVANIRGEPVENIIKEFAESIRAAQRQFRAMREVEGGRLAAEKSAAALSRLTDAVTNAAASVAKFETSMTVLGAVFNGSGGPGRVTPLGGFNTLGTGTGVEFRQSAGAVGAVLGSGGDSFVRSADAADRLSRVMPSVLSAIGSSTLGPDESYGKKTRDLLYAQLLPGLDEAGRQRALEADPQLNAAIEAAVGSVARIQADSENDGGIQRRIQQDAGRVATEVTEAFAGPLREAGERMARAVEEHANKYAEGLTQARNMLAAAGESRDRAGEARLAGRRVAAEFEADRTGRSAAGILTLDELNAPFRERQARLAGGIGESPAAIAARLREVTDEIAVATRERDQALRTRGADGTSRDRFAAAAGNLDRLIGTSNNLQAALRNLANASERAAGLQEKLTAANANRDGRLGYAEKYLFADSEGRARMQRGQQLVIGLDRGRTNFANLSVDEQRLAIETLGDFGQTRLASGRTAAGLRQQLIGGMRGVTDEAQEADRRGLQDQIQGVFTTAEAAQRALAGFQQDVHARFISDLTRMHEQFFARLAVNFAAEQLAAARNGLASADATRGRLDRETQQRDVLSRVGVANQAGLVGLRNSQGEVDTFLRANRRLADLQENVPLAAGVRDEIRRNLPTLTSELAGGFMTDPRTDALRACSPTAGSRA